MMTVWLVLWMWMVLVVLVNLAQFSRDVPLDRSCTRPSLAQKIL
jgi:hypothetical protein